MRNVTESLAAVTAVVVLVLLGGVLFLPLGLPLLYVADQRKKELKKGELEDAKKF